MTDCAVHSLLVAMLLVAAEPPHPHADAARLGIPFQRYTVKDSFRRTVTFYLSAPPKDAKDTRRPVALFIEGSGCQSLFCKRGEQIAGGYHNLLLKEARDRV